MLRLCLQTADSVAVSVKSASIRNTCGGLLVHRYRRPASALRNRNIICQLSIHHSTFSATFHFLREPEEVSCVFDLINPVFFFCRLISVSVYLKSVLIIFGSYHYFRFDPDILIQPVRVLIIRNVCSFRRSSGVNTGRYFTVPIIAEIQISAYGYTVLTGLACRHSESAAVYINRTGIGVCKNAVRTSTVTCKGIGAAVNSDIACMRVDRIPLASET